MLGRQSASSWFTTFSLVILFLNDLISAGDDECKDDGDGDVVSERELVIHLDTSWSNRGYGPLKTLSPYDEVDHGNVC